MSDTFSSTQKELLDLLSALRTACVGDEKAISALPHAKADFNRDLPVFLVMSLVLFICNWGLRFLVGPVVKAVLGVRQNKVPKILQSFIEMFFYSFFTYLGVCVVPRQTWVWPSIHWWAGFEQGEHDLLRADLRCYYMMYSARYFQMVFSVLLEPKRKDFAEMLLHHLLTTLVTVASFLQGLNRVGVVVMLLLDPADVPLHLAKLCKYVSEAKPKGQNGVWMFLANRLFEVFGTVFFITRLVMFGYVVHAATIEARATIKNPPFIAWVCLGVLFTLWILQAYWFALILRVAIRLWRHGDAVEDIRSDDEAEPTTPKDGSRLWRVSYTLPVFAVIAARGGYSSEEGAAYMVEVIEEAKVQLSGLGVVFFGGSAAGSNLSQGPPKSSRDIGIFALYTTVLFFLNWGVRIFIVNPVVKSVVGVKQATLAKYSQSVMEASIYGAFMCIGLRVVPSQDWVWPSSEWWRGFADGGHEIMRADLRSYYMLYVARYMQAILSVLLETRRRDFVEMVIHHLVTVLLCGISFYYGWNRVGVVIMALFDPADVPLHLAKICKYTARATNRPVFEFFADRLFELFGLTFFCTRLVLFGYVCWSAHVEAGRYFPKGIPEWICVALLYTLLALQMYWFGLIMKVAMKLFCGLAADDPRSDDEGTG